MNYLNFFKIIQDRTSIISELDKVKNEDGIDFPKVLKIFYQTYDFSHINKETLLSFYYEKYNTNIQFYDSKYINDNHINLIKLFKPLEILNIMKSIYSNESKILSEYIAIGECSDQGVLLVGKSENNKDKIYIEYAHSDERIRLINDNIFDFFQDYVIHPVENDLPAGIFFKNLYKNWDEDFWRVNNG